MKEPPKPPVTGGCQCGAIRYAFDAPLQNSHACHCRMCQRATGGVFAALVGARKADFNWICETPSFFASSDLATRAFCEKCGTPLGFCYNKQDGFQYVTIGSLDDPATAPITHQYGVESKLPWVSFCEDMPQDKTGEDVDAEVDVQKMKVNQSQP